MVSEGLSYYEFGTCRLDIANHKLLRNGEPVVLAQKTFDILCFLVQNHGKVLKKEELLTKFWEETYVEETHIAQQIYRIRKAIKDEETGETFIETVPKFGYRFTEKVREKLDFQSIPNPIPSSPTYPNQTNGQEAAEFTAERSSTLSDSFYDHNTIPAPSVSDKQEASLLQTKSIVAGLIAIIALASIAGYLYYTQNKAGDLSDIRSIAVIPFEQIGGEKDEKLGLGLADSIISKFSTQSELSVTPTSTVVKFVAEGNTNPVEIGRKLEVDAVLTGTIQREKGIVRTNLQLISVKKQVPVWTDKFDLEFTNIFALQDEISARVTKNLPLRLTNAPNQLLTESFTDNPEAAQAYWMGVSFWSMHSSPGFENAIKQFNKAIEKDPNFALAYAYLADTYGHRGHISRIVSEEEALIRGKAAAKKALELDPQCPEALAAMGFIKSMENKGNEAFVLMRKAVDLKPNHSHAIQRLSWMYADKGDIKQAVREARTARNLDPQSVYANFFLARMLYLARDYSDALNFVDKTLKLEGNFFEVKLLKISIYEQLSSFDKAENVLRNLEKNIRKNNPMQNLEKNTWENSPMSMLIMSHIQAKSGKIDAAKHLLNQALLAEKKGIRFNYLVAHVYAAIGEEEKAVDRIAKMIDSFGGDIYILKYEPNFDSLRKNSAFIDAVKAREESLGW